MPEREHRVHVLPAWPSGRFVACTCTAQSPASRNEDDLFAWTYEHLGRDLGTAPPDPATAQARTWQAIPDDGLF